MQIKDTRTLRLGLFGVLIITVFRGVRFPNLWSYTHFLFNYDLGFIKRGLVGSIFSLFGNPYFSSYEFFTFLSIFVLMVDVLLIWLFLKDLIKENDLIATAIAFLFASSMGIAFLAHMIGYLDLIGLGLTMLTLRIKNVKIRMISALIILPVMILMHEVQFVIYFPVLFLSLLFDSRQWTIRNRVMVLVCISLVAGISMLSVLDRGLEDKDRMAQHLEEKAGHSLRETAFEIFNWSTKDNIKVTWDAWSKAVVKRKMLDSMLVTMPLLILLLLLIWEMTSKSPTYLRVFSILAPIAPLLLHIVAWDHARWNAFSVLVSFFIFWLLKTRVYDYTKLKKSQNLLIYMAFLLFLNGASYIPFFDERNIQSFPYKGHQDWIIETIEGKDPFSEMPIY